MVKALIYKFFGSPDERELRKLQPWVERVNQLEPQFMGLSDEELKAKTIVFRERLARGESLDSLLPEAFAATRESARRKLGMRHYDVQLIGGMTLHRGRIAEMKTGEGKTLVATLPLYLNALEGKGAHLVTVNDYLAKRDAAWMSPVFEGLGLNVGVIVHGLNDAQRREAYHRDITYGTNNEFGFDYLRDNMKVSPDSLVQRELHYSIVDEVDSILIDEARTPLIISGPTNQTTDKYKLLNGIMPFLKREVHYTVDEKARTVHLTDEGVEAVQKRLQIENLYDSAHIELVHHVDQALRAHVIFKRDVDYVVKEGEVIIVDEFTGRLMPGRRYSDGLHQALEAKEGVQVENENQTLASITFQNYFRMYKKLAGMTGTAATEAEEFGSIYRLEVTSIPTHNPMVREDFADVVFKSEKAKFKAIVTDIKEANAKGQPVLVGTVSIEKSERLSELLKREGIHHVVLNAKQHEREAGIVAEAGQRGAVTIATNMAGRGTDIVLGPGVKDLGGLFILGTERHESRRIDNQLRGRAGRQGDPGKSRFFMSLEDDLLRIFAGDRLMKVMNFLGMEEDEPIEHTMISRAIEDAQTRVEARNFDVRKHLLKYDDVMSYQRKIVYAWRRKLLFKEDIRSDIQEMIHEVLEGILNASIPEKAPLESWNWKELAEDCEKVFGDGSKVQRLEQEAALGGISEQELFNSLYAHLKELYLKKEGEFSAPVLRRLESMLLLHTLDDRWKDHLLDMDQLREGINLRGYAQKDPILDYQKETFRLFESMFALVKQEFLAKIFRVRLAPSMEQEEFLSEDERKERLERKIEAEQREREERVRQLNLFSGPAKVAEAPKVTTVKRDVDKVGRNDPCPCGSGKKYKKCHGASSATG